MRGDTGTRIRQVTHNALKQRLIEHGDNL